MSDLKVRRIYKIKLKKPCKIKNYRVQRRYDRKTKQLVQQYNWR